MITAFVDESGDLGRGGRYFVIALVVSQKSKRLANLMKAFCAKYKLHEVKASLLSFPQKQEILNKITSVTDYSVSYIVADKKNIDNQQLLKDKNLLYNYLFSFLAKEIIAGADDDICILLDNRSIKTKSINSLCDYIRIKSFTQWGFQNSLDMRYVDSRDSKVIQAADVVANAIYAHYMYGSEHFYRMLAIEESIRFPQNRFGKD